MTDTAIPRMFRTPFTITDPDIEFCDYDDARPCDNSRLEAVWDHVGLVCPVHRDAFVDDPRLAAECTPDDIERLARALPGHRYDDPAYPGDHDRCLAVAASIIKTLRSTADTVSDDTVIGKDDPMTPELVAALVELLDDYLTTHGPDGYPQPMPKAWRTVCAALYKEATRQTAHVCALPSEDMEPPDFVWSVHRLNAERSMNSQYPCQWEVRGPTDPVTGKQPYRYGVTLRGAIENLRAALFPEAAAHVCTLPSEEQLAEVLPCEDPEEPCDSDGRDEHRWCDHCIARMVVNSNRVALERMTR